MVTEKNKIHTNRIRGKKYTWTEVLYVLILALYPMRHIHIGLDLWDTGYNYANFQYMGLEHMDSMWLFSTYLSNAVGHFLTKLPGAGSLVGMNFYTGLFVSALALMGYFFCTGKLKISHHVTFVGELLAISFCWSPTAVLYNYLTYVLFLLCVILLYTGLLQEKKWYLFTAGVCLGANVLVRFSNLPEAAMIVAVWAYGVLELPELRKVHPGCKEAYEKKTYERKTLKRTLWCLAGYLTALAVLMGYISVRYGMDEYIDGITQLFGMTEHATDYTAVSMVMGIVDTYVEHLYWVKRILVFVTAGMAVCAAVGWLLTYCKRLEKNEPWRKVLKRGSYVVCAACAAVMLWWFYNGKVRFTSCFFDSYDSIWHPGVVFLMLTMLIAVIRIFHKNAPKEEKLISGMVLLVVLLTSIGSNNKVYPSFNNLFVAAPYTLWQSVRFVSVVKERELRIGREDGRHLRILLSPMAAKCVLVAFLALFLFAVTCFGGKFVFVEATGAQNVSVTMENNEILKGTRMSPERAGWMSSISDYVKANKLQGREVILYGKIPALSFYLQMPSAFNPWSDLESYSVSKLEKELEKLEGEITEKGAERPVIIAEKSYEHFFPTDIAEVDFSKEPDYDEAMQRVEKWMLIADFMKEVGYEKTFSNDKFVVWE